MRADVRDPAAVERAVEGCGLVVDNAVLPPVSRATPAELRSVNVEGCRTVLEAARRAGAYAVHVSSSSVYGVPATLPVTEETPFAPFEPYGASKAEAEGVVEEQRRRGLAVSSLRSRALLGRGRLGLFEIVFRRVAAGRRVPLFGRGGARIQMCDAEEFSEAVLAATERRAVGSYNLGTASFGTVREDLEGLIGHAGTGARLQPVPLPVVRGGLRALEATGRSPFTRWHWVSSATSFHCDLSRARSELGWAPRRSNLDALAAAYDEWLAAPERAGHSPHTRPLPGRIAGLLRG